MRPPSGSCRGTLIAVTSSNQTGGAKGTPGRDIQTRQGTSGRVQLTEGAVTTTTTMTMTMTIPVVTAATTAAMIASTSKQSQLLSLLEGTTPGKRPLDKALGGFAAIGLVFLCIRLYRWSEDDTSSPPSTLLDSVQKLTRFVWDGVGTALHGRMHNVNDWSTCGGTCHCGTVEFEVME